MFEPSAPLTHIVPVASGTVIVLLAVCSVIENSVSLPSTTGPSNIRLPVNNVFPSLPLNEAIVVLLCAIVPVLPLAVLLLIITEPPAALLVLLPPNNCKAPPALSVPVASPPLIYKSPPASSVCLSLDIVATPSSSAPIFKVSLSYVNSLSA